MPISLRPYAGLLYVAFLGLVLYLIYVVVALNGIKDNRALQTVIFTHMQGDILVLKRENAALKEANAELTAHVIDANNEKDDLETQKAVLEERLSRANKILF